MILGYETPGMNGVNWLLEKTVKPEAMEFFQHINGLFQINWSFMLCQVLLIVSLGTCGYVAASAIDQKPIGNMIILVTVVCCLDSIIRCFTR
jgi:hypothetical protein